MSLTDEQKNLMIGNASQVKVICLEGNRLNFRCFPEFRVWDGESEWISTGESVPMGQVEYLPLGVTITVVQGNLKRLQACKSPEEVESLFWSWFLQKQSVTSIKAHFASQREEGRKEGVREMQKSMRKLLGINGALYV